MTPVSVLRIKDISKAMQSPQQKGNGRLVGKHCATQFFQGLGSSSSRRTPMRLRKKKNMILKNEIGQVSKREILLCIVYTLPITQFTSTIYILGGILREVEGNGVYRKVLGVCMLFFWA